MATAFLAMGAWAAWANRAHDGEAATIAFLVQGALSAAITVVMKHGLEAGRRRFRGLTGRVLPPLLSLTTIALLLATAHALAGTPEILSTIALPWSVSTLYAFAYAAHLPETPS